MIRAAVRGVMLCLLLASVSAQAQTTLTEPRWELGVGLAGFSFPAYRGSTQRQTRVLPLPYAIYRGERLALRREGMRLRLLESDRWSLGLSASAALQADTDTKGSAREGMPELDPSFEVGPSLDYWLRAPGVEPWAWRLRLPLRAAAATDFRHFQGIGWVANPTLQAIRFGQMAQWSLRWNVSLGALAATEKYHRYFYAVPAAFVTSDRSAYRARAGFGGSRIGFGLSARNGRWRLAGGLVLDWLDGASFDDSPLVVSRTAVTLGVGVAYQFAASPRRVAVPLD